jgi:hypothetical protein
VPCADPRTLRRSMLSVLKYLANLFKQGVLR